MGTDRVDVRPAATLNFVAWANELALYWSPGRIAR